MSTYSGFSGSVYPQSTRTVRSDPRTEYAQSMQHSGSQPKDDDDRICGGILVRPNKWKLKTFLTMFEVNLCGAITVFNVR